MCFGIPSPRIFFGIHGSCILELFSNFDNYVVLLSLLTDILVNSLLATHDTFSESMVAQENT